jgi:predicted nucleotidyltransferase
MVFTIDDIRKRVIPIVIKYGINTFSLFGSYARNEANENSDLDFVMDKGDLKGLQYVSLAYQCTSSTLYLITSRICISSMEFKV